MFFLSAQVEWAAALGCLRAAVEVGEICFLLTDSFSLQELMP
jgi:hypothetical protein